MAVAEFTSPRDAPTQETGSVPLAGLPGGAAVAAPAAPPQPAHGRFLALEQGDDIVLLEVSGDVCHIGRNPSCAVVLDEPSVSRRHAVLARRGGATAILDDRSLNGVTVNGRRIAEALLRDGDSVGIGRVMLRWIERVGD